MFLQHTGNCDPPPCLPARSRDPLPLKKNNKIQQYNDGQHEGATSLISLMNLRTGCFESPRAQQEPNVVNTSALLVVLDDALGISEDSLSRLPPPPPQFQDSPGSSASRRTMGRLNSMIPVKKPERQPSWENLTRSNELETPAHDESSANAVFDLTTAYPSPAVLHRATSMPGDIALCKPKRKSSSDNLADLDKRRH